MAEIETRKARIAKPSVAKDEAVKAEASKAEAPKAEAPGASAGALAHGEGRKDILRRLRRVEGQLRGVMRMIEEGEGCMPVAQQLSAARKALDAVFFRMTVCYLEQEFDEGEGLDEETAEKLRTVGTLLGKYG